MARKPAFSAKQFKDAWKRHKDVKKVSEELNTSFVTVYKWLAKLEIETPGRVQTSELVEAIRESYKGQRDIRELAASLNRTIGDIRYHLIKIMGEWWDKPHIKKMFPKPRCPNEYKVFLEMQEDESVFDHPEEITVLTGVELSFVESYVQRVFEYRSKNAKA